jgi:hypothetical protein
MCNNAMVRWDDNEKFKLINYCHAFSQKTWSINGSSTTYETRFQRRRLYTINSWAKKIWTIELFTLGQPFIAFTAQ